MQQINYCVFYSAYLKFFFDIIYFKREKYIEKKQRPSYFAAQTKIKFNIHNFIEELFYNFKE